eukprot:scaffold672579_cov74-Prasinocladus_malaysianus.AAC.1
MGHQLTNRERSLCQPFASSRAYCLISKPRRNICQLQPSYQASGIWPCVIQPSRSFPTRITTDAAQHHFSSDRLPDPDASVCNSILKLCFMACQRSIQSPSGVARENAHRS